MMNMPAPRATTILVENIPEDHRSDKRLTQFFEGIFGESSVESAFVVRETAKLEGLLQQRTDAEKAVKDAEAQNEKTPDHHQKMLTTHGYEDVVEYYTKKRPNLNDKSIIEDLHDKVEEERANVSNSQ